MSIGLDVWIGRPGAACQVDDASWRVTIYDAHGKIYQWAGATYANLNAPHAHWAGTIPPGTYVVRAVNSATGAKTDHAIVTVEPMRASSVILYVASGKEEERPDRPKPTKCKITIDEVIGSNQPVRQLYITGSAQGCTKIELEIKCGNKPKKAVVSVSGGSWKADVKYSPQDECQCGGPISVIARCVEHPDCTARYDTDRLSCRDLIK
jgi:hypothetical protein